MQKGLVIGCRKTRQTARLIADKAKWAYTETYVDSLEGFTSIFRYGNSSELNMSLGPECGFGGLDSCASNYGIRVINRAKQIKIATDKLMTRNKLREMGLEVPYTLTCSDPPDVWPDVYPAVIRPIYHMKGHSFQIVNSIQELSKYWKDGFYCSELILKREEFRVIGLFGKVVEVNVKNKIRDDADDIIRNHGHGWKFKWIPYAEAQRPIIVNALKAIKVLGLDFGAVDLCVDDHNRVVIFEVNTAPGMVERKATKLAEKINE